MYLNTNFEFNRIKSIDMNVGAYHVDDTSMTKNIFGVNRGINKDIFNNRSYFNGIENKPIEFDMSLAKINGEKWTQEERIKISEWLYQDEYKPLRLCDNPYLVYYAMISGNSERYDIGNNEGWINIHVECANPYCYTNLGVEKHIFNEYENSIEIKSRSNINEPCYPIFELESLDNQTIEFQPLYDRLSSTIIKNVKKGEKLIIDNLNQDIITKIDKYKFSDFNKQWFELHKGINRIKIKGKMILYIKYQFPIAF